MSTGKPATFIDHIDLRVRSLETSTPFYDALMGSLGMHRISDDPSQTEPYVAGDWLGYAYADETPISTPFFGIIEAPDDRADASRIAFAAASRVEVDRIASAVRAAGAMAIEGPELCTEYDPTYYAVFFEDTDGNRFEVCCHAASES